MSNHLIPLPPDNEGPFHPPGPTAAPPLPLRSGSRETPPFPPTVGPTTRPTFLADSRIPPLTSESPATDDMSENAVFAFSSRADVAAFLQRLHNRNPGDRLDAPDPGHQHHDGPAPRTPRIPAMAPASAIPALDITTAERAAPPSGGEKVQKAGAQTTETVDQDSPPPASPSPSDPPQHHLRGGGGGAHSPFPSPFRHSASPTDPEDKSDAALRELKSFLHDLGIGGPPAEADTARKPADDKKAAYQRRMAQLRDPAAAYVCELVGSTSAAPPGVAQTRNDACSAALVGLRGGAGEQHAEHGAAPYYEGLEEQSDPWFALTRELVRSDAAVSGEGSAQPAPNEPHPTHSGGRAAAAPYYEGLEEQSDPWFPLSRELVRSDAVSAGAPVPGWAGAGTWILPPGGRHDPHAPHSGGHTAAPAAAPHFTPSMRGGASSPSALWLAELQPQRSCVVSPWCGPFAPPFRAVPGCAPPVDMRDDWCRAPPLPPQPQPVCWNCGALCGMATPGFGAAGGGGEVVVNAFHLSRVDDRRRKAARDRKADGEEGEDEEGDGGGGDERGEGMERERARARMERGSATARERARERREWEEQCEWERREVALEREWERREWERRYGRGR